MSCGANVIQKHTARLFVAHLALTLSAQTLACSCGATGYPSDWSLNMLARIFYRPPYESETTQFIQQLKTAKPSLEAEQRAGRALLWDKSVDRDASRSFEEARVAQKAYVYHVKA
jgi:hypothetical protein